MDKHTALQPNAIVWNDPQTGNACVYHVLEYANMGTKKKPLFVKIDFAVELAKVEAQGLNPVAIPQVDIQADRDYRGSWELKDGKIMANSAKAKDMALGKMRAEREVKFAKLTQDAEQGRDVAADRQTLRGCTDGVKNLDLVETHLEIADMSAQLNPLAVVPEV